MSLWDWARESWDCGYRAACDERKPSRTPLRRFGPLGYGQDQLGEGIDGARAAHSHFRVLYDAQAAAQRDPWARLPLRHGRALCRDGRQRRVSRARAGFRQLLRDGRTGGRRSARHRRAAVVGNRLAGCPASQSPPAGGAQHFHLAAVARLFGAETQGPQHRCGCGDQAQTRRRRAGHHALGGIRLRGDQRPLRPRCRGLAGHRRGSRQPLGQAKSRSSAPGGGIAGRRLNEAGGTERGGNAPRDGGFKWPILELFCYSDNPSNGTLSMARITVEDCLQNEPNLFNLVLLAAKRARRLANGAEATVEWENDKPTVVALREIAAGNITLEMLEEPEEPAQPPVSELDIPSDFRAPQLGLGD